ncbi:MAG: hypothetical protein LBL24_01330 [Bacteroidales bacterium]|jgi:hypothetical protein|nr:hypothetical protein [Bacteroidales bacterium]
MGKAKAPWDELSMKDMQELISYYVDAGYTDIDKMKNHYNSFTLNEQMSQL